MNVLTWIASGILLVFTARRYLHWLASFFPRPAPPTNRNRTIDVLIAARNEELRLPKTLAALDRCDYPSHLLRFVLVNDGSEDATLRIMDQWSASRKAACALSVSPAQGKAAALNRALVIAPTSDLVAVVDADTEPSPDALALLAGAFDNPAVGAACGYPDPGRNHATTTSRYAALERWVYHLVVLAGKDRLGLNPPAIGALSAFRRAALEEVGGFPSDALAEDVSVSMALVRHGWRTRWIGEAVTREEVPDDLMHFRRQRTRWNRGLVGTFASVSTIEDIFVAAGYLDRIALAIVVILSILGQVPLWIPAVYFAAPAVLAVTALGRARVRNPISYLSAILPMLAVDLAVTLSSVLAHIMKTSPAWSPDRSARESHMRKKDKVTGFPGDD